jgi:hypothetical protein
MAGINDYSNTAGSNTTINGIDIAEGCSPAGINNAIRQLMADIADMDDGVVPLQTPDINGGTIDGAVIGGTTPAAATFTSITTTGDINFGDNDKAVFGAGSDLQIYHDGSHSIIADAGTGNLEFRGTHLVARNGGDTGNYFQAIDGAQIELFYNGSKKFETTSGGINVTGTITFDGGTTSADLNFGDNDKAQFGASQDLQVFHDGSNSYIIDNGTGNLIIRGVNLDFQSTSGEDYINCTNNGGVTLRYDTAGKLSTTSGGVTVTGTVTADGLSLGDNEKAQFGAGNDLQIYHNGSNSYIADEGTGNLLIRANNLEIQNIAGENYITATSNAAVNIYYDNSKKFETTSAGVTVTGTLTETSSIEYKENVKPLEFNEAIYNVNAVKYDRKDGSSKDEVGVIAEELYEVLPDLVETKEGKPNSVKYTKLTMYLLEALKKQNKEIKMLKEKLN